MELTTQRDKEVYDFARKELLEEVEKMIITNRINGLGFDYYLFIEELKSMKEKK